MKHRILILLFFICSTVAAQTGKFSKHDEKFVGTWSGSEIDQQQLGLQKYWIQHRFPDGTFILLFTTLRDGIADSFSEKGKWWIEDGKFHELHFVSGVTDIYSFTFLGDDNIKFTSTQIIDSVNETYDFIDSRVEDE